MISRRLAAPLLVLLLASACSTLPGAVAAEPPAASPGARPGGVLRVGITQPSSVEPKYATDPAGQLIASIVCEPWLTIDPVTGLIDPLKPGLAEKFVVGNDGTSVTIKVRKKTLLHDGTELKSIDGTYALQTLANPESASSFADLLRGVQQFEEFRRRVEEGSLIGGTLAWQGVRVIEPYSFEITMAGKEPDIARVMTHPATAPFSKAVAQKNPSAFGEKPICAGPYKMAAPFKQGDTEIRLTRFSGYQGRNANFTRGGKGYASEIRFRIFPDGEAAYREFEAGNLDATMVPPPRLAEAKGRYGNRIISGAHPQVEFIGLPRGPESPFTKTGVRVALSRAIDRTKIVETVYGGSRQPAGGYLPPALGTAVHRQNACATNAPLTADVEGARAALARSNVDLKGQVLKLYFNDEFSHRGLAEAVAAQWREVLGVNVELQPMNWDQYLQKATTGAGFDGPFRMSWVGPYHSPQAYLGPLFLSGNIGSSNLQRYSDQLFDEQFEQDAIVQVEEADRILQFQRLEGRVCSQMQLIPIAFSQTHMVVGEGVGLAGQRVLALNGLPVLQELYVRQ